MPTSRFTIKFLLCILLLLSSCTVFSKQAKPVVYSHLVAADVLRQEGLQVELKRLQNSTSFKSRHALIQDWVITDSLEALAKDRLLYEATLLFRSEKKSLKAVALMEQLSNYESTAYLPLFDAGRSMNVAAFEVGASARATLIHWQIEDYYRTFSVLSAKPRAFLQNLQDLKINKQIEIGVVKAINNAAIDEVNALALQINNSSEMSSKIFPSKVLGAIALRTANVDLYRLLINQYQHSADLQADVLLKLSHLPEEMLAVDKVSILMLAVQHEKLADTAIIALADFQNNFSQVRLLLFDKLTDKNFGGTAAKAIGESDDLLILQQLALNLDSADGILMRRSLLAIYFNYQKFKALEAKKLLEEFYHSTNNLQLKAEVEQWLL